MIEENNTVPAEERLDILEFDLDIEAREKLFEEAALERDNTQQLLEAECLERERLAQVIKHNTWDKMEVKSRCIKVNNDTFHFAFN